VRVKHVTAKLTVEPLASSARSNAPNNHSERSAPARSKIDFSDMPFAIGLISRRSPSASNHKRPRGDYVPNTEAGPRSTYAGRLLRAMCLRSRRKQASRGADRHDGQDQFHT